MNIYLIIIVFALLLEFVLYNISRYLDLRNLSNKLPEEFEDYYSAEEYVRSQEYLRENTRFSYFTSSFDLLLIFFIIFLGFFNTVDIWVRGFGFSSVITGLLFFGVLFFLQDIIGTPFSIYKTFVIEGK